MNLALPCKSLETVRQKHHWESQGSILLCRFCGCSPPQATKGFIEIEPLKTRMRMRKSSLDRWWQVPKWIKMAHHPASYWGLDVVANYIKLHQRIVQYMQICAPRTRVYITIMNLQIVTGKNNNPFIDRVYTIFNFMTLRARSFTHNNEQISPQPNGTPMPWSHNKRADLTTTQWHTGLKRYHFWFFSCYIQRFRLRSICYGWNVYLGNHCFQMGFCIGTPPSGAQSQPTSFPTNMFILVALRQFKTVRILDKCPFKVGLCIGTPPSSAIPGVCLSAIYAKDINISTSID